jgi:hypothetical protein
MTLPLVPIALALGVGALAVALASCSVATYPRSFDRAAAAMVRPPPTAEGPWEGKWTSRVNGHHGPLWCIVQPSPGKPGHYDFRYRAGWGLIRFGDYTHTVPASLAADGSMLLAGQMVLPGGFGTYEVEGRLTRDTFEAVYKSKGDHGTMSLRRPGVQ